MIRCRGGRFPLLRSMRGSILFDLLRLPLLLLLRQSLFRLLTSVCGFFIDVSAILPLLPFIVSFQNFSKAILWTDLFVMLVELRNIIALLILSRLLILPLLFLLFTPTCGDLPLFTALPDLDGYASSLTTQLVSRGPIS